MLVEKWGYSDKVAGIFTSFPMLGVSLLSPIFGILVDKIGRRMTIS